MKGAKDAIKKPMKAVGEFENTDGNSVERSKADWQKQHQQTLVKVVNSLSNLDKTDIRKVTTNTRLIEKQQLIFIRAKNTAKLAENSAPQLIMKSPDKKIQQIFLEDSTPSNYSNIMDEIRNSTTGLTLTDIIKQEVKPTNEETVAPRNPLPEDNFPCLQQLLHEEYSNEIEVKKATNEVTPDIDIDDAGSSKKRINKSSGKKTRDFTSIFDMQVANIMNKKRKSVTRFDLQIKPRNSDIKVPKKSGRPKVPIERYLISSPEVILQRLSFIEELKLSRTSRSIRLTPCQIKKAMEAANISSNGLANVCSYKQEKFLISSPEVVLERLSFIEKLKLSKKLRSIRLTPSQIDAGPGFQNKSMEQEVEEVKCAWHYTDHPFLNPSLPLQRPLKRRSLLQEAQKVEEIEVSPSFNLEVPGWRIKKYEPLETDPGIEDVTELAFLNRHAKYEMTEKRQRIWAIRSFREKIYTQRLRKAALERERRADGDWPNEDSDPDEIRYIRVGSDLHNFDSIIHTLPELKKCPFELPWNVGDFKPTKMEID